MKELKQLNPLMKRGREFLNVKYPILCGAMTWVSEPNLVAAVANAGCFGCLAGGNAPTEILRKQILETRSLTNHPFGINLVLDKMKKMGYIDIDIKPFPIFMEEKDFDKIDWYRVIGKKPE